MEPPEDLISIKIDRAWYARVRGSKPIYDRTKRRLGRLAVRDRDLVHTALEMALSIDSRTFDGVTVEIDDDGMTVTDGVVSVRRECGRSAALMALSGSDVAAGLRLMLAEEGR
mgnify:FL=1